MLSIYNLPASGVWSNQRAASMREKWPLEKKLHTYRTPKGFYGTRFRFKWTETDQGAQVDLRTAGYTLWTMGEGF